MRKIENINVLIQFEQLLAQNNDMQIIEHNELTKEMYFDIKERAAETMDAFCRSGTYSEPTWSKRRSAGELINEMFDEMFNDSKETNYHFYERRVDERAVYDVGMLLQFEYLDEDLLRNLFLTKARQLVLVRVNELYVGLLLGQDKKESINPFSGIFK